MCDPAPDHITAPAVDARYEVHVLAPHGEGPRRVSRTVERLVSVRTMYRSDLDNRRSSTKPSERRGSARSQNYLQHAPAPFISLKSVCMYRNY